MIDYKEKETPRSRKILSSKKTERVLLVLIVVTFFASLVLSAQVGEQRSEQQFATEGAGQALELYESRTIVVDGNNYSVIISNTDEKRILGLSNSTNLPDGIDGMLFIFHEPGLHSIWMKDMNYPIDIYWLDEAFSVVHQELNVSPDTYPSESFAPNVPALYVLEIPSK